MIIRNQIPFEMKESRPMYGFGLICHSGHPRSDYDAEVMAKYLPLVFGGYRLGHGLVISEVRDEARRRPRPVIGRYLREC